jgi:hypothetical protein
MKRRVLLIGALALCSSLDLEPASTRAGSDPADAATGPVFSDTGPEAAIYGAAEGYRIGLRETALLDQVVNLVGTYSHFDELFSSRRVLRTPTPWAFKREAEPPLFYSFNSDRFSIADYLSRNPTTGLLIARDDTILYEHYQYARTDRDRFLSQSMAKTITAMLIGIAVSESKIKSIADAASAYVPGLANTEYGKTSIRDLLHMASGVSFMCMSLLKTIYGCPILS